MWCVSTSFSTEWFSRKAEKLSIVDHEQLQSLLSLLLEHFYNIFFIFLASWLSSFTLWSLLLELTLTPLCFLGMNQSRCILRGTNLLLSRILPSMLFNQRKEVSLGLPFSVEPAVSIGISIQQWPVWPNKSFYIFKIFTEQSRGMVGKWLIVAIFQQSKGVIT